MASTNDAAAIAEALPDVTLGVKYGNRTLLVGGRGFAWQRPFSKADVKRFGSAPVPSGPILAVRVADLPTKDALLAEQLPGVFAIPHFDNYAAALIRLDAVGIGTLKRLITDAWLATAPDSMASSYHVRGRRRRVSSSKPRAKRRPPKA